MGIKQYCTLTPEICRFVKEKLAQKHKRSIKEYLLIFCSFLRWYIGVIKQWVAMFGNFYYFFTKELFLGRKTYSNITTKSVISVFCESPPIRPLFAAPLQVYATANSYWTFVLVPGDAGVPDDELDDDEDDDNSECVVCLSDMKDTLILPCKHLCLCSSCGTFLFMFYRIISFKADCIHLCRLKSLEVVPSM